MYIRAASRNLISKSIFSTTFMVAFTLAVANSLVPCPAEGSVNNESTEAAKQTREKLAREQQMKEELEKSQHRSQ